jgi:uncharacterized LabA/DUF88 family protein
MFRDPSDDHGRRPRSQHSQRLRHGAVLVDMENIYRSLAEPEDAGDADTVDDQAIDDCVEILRNLRERLRRRYHVNMAIGRSYADFARLGGDAQTQLQLLAFEPRFTMTARGTSAADILLSIDAIEMLLTRPELDVFVIVGGDRDYLPVVRRIREHMKRVILVGFGRATSGDLRQVVGEENFIAAESLLPGEIVHEAGPRRDAEYEEVEEAEHEAPSDDSGTYAANGDASDLPRHEDVLDLCMSELLTAYYQFGGRTVWLTPFLRILNDKFPYLDNRGRKRLVEDLQARHAIRIEKVEGDPYPYSVVEINWEDPWVQQLDEARGNA